MKFDGLVRSPKGPFSVIPANPGSGSGTGAGIQFIYRLRKHLDSGLHRSDGFHECSKFNGSNSSFSLRHSLFDILRFAFQGLYTL